MASGACLYGNGKKRAARRMRSMRGPGTIAGLGYTGRKVRARWERMSERKAGTPWRAR